MSERYLSKREQIEGEKPKEESLANSDLCHTWSNAIEVSRAKIRDSSNSRRAEDQIEVTYHRTWLFGNHTDDLIAKNYFPGVSENDH